MKKINDNLKIWGCVACAALVLTSSLSRAAYTSNTGTPDNIDNDLDIDQTLSVDGSLITLDADATTGGVTLQLDEVTVSSILRPQLTFIGNATSPGLFVWGYDDGAGGVTVQMELAETNQLSFYDPVSPFAAKIIIDPDSSNPQITIDGEEVLTTVGGIAPYLPQGAAVNIGSTASTAGSHSFAIGNNASAVADSVAVGNDSIAGAQHAYAFGKIAQATGYSSTAIGTNSKAQYNGTTAIGESSTSSGQSSTAIGVASLAQGMYQTAIGPFNLGVGSPISTDFSSDLIFIVGNGTNTSNRSNAFTVNWNGDTWMEGTVRANRIEGGVNPTASGINSIAVGRNAVASHDHTAAFGDGYAEAPWAFATGYATHATGYFSMATGYQTRTEYHASFAANWFTKALGHHSASFGTYTTAQGVAQFVVGRYNELVGGNYTDDTSPLFVVGNGDGDDPVDRSNALVVTKGGDATVSGALQAEVLRTTQAAGDISMGAFTN